MTDRELIEALQTTGPYLFPKMADRVMDEAAARIACLSPDAARWQELTLRAREIIRPELIATWDQSDMIGGLCFVLDGMIAERSLSQLVKHSTGEST